MATTIDTSSPYISGYTASAVGNNSIDKIASNSAITKAKDDPANLSITDGIRLHERALSQSIANATSGIAVSNIAQDALNQQKDILGEIKQLTIQASNDTETQQDREQIAVEIYQKLQSFDSIAENTNYNGETLLKTEEGETNDLSVVAQDKIVSIYKADTQSISESLKVFLGDFPAKIDARENLYNAVEQSISDISSYSDNFEKVSNTLESMVKEQLTDVAHNTTAKEIVKNVDFGQDVSDFTKTQLLSQMGYLMQSQANANTQRTIEILK